MTNFKTDFVLNPIRKPTLLEELEQAIKEEFIDSEGILTEIRQSELQNDLQKDPKSELNQSSDVISPKSLDTSQD
jgi:hypothetical protein